MKFRKELTLNAEQCQMICFKVYQRKRHKKDVKFVLLGEPCKWILF